MDEIKQRMFSSRNLSVSNPGLIVSKFPDLFLCSLISMVSRGCCPNPLSLSEKNF